MPLSSLIRGRRKGREPYGVPPAANLPSQGAGGDRGAKVGPSCWVPISAVECRTGSVALPRPSTALNGANGHPEGSPERAELDRYSLALHSLWGLQVDLRTP